MYAGETPLADVPMRAIGGSGLHIFDGGEEELSQRVRGIYAVAADGEPSAEDGYGGASGAAFYEAAWEVVTYE